MVDIINILILNLNYNSLSKYIGNTNIRLTSMDEHEFCFGIEMDIFYLNK